VPRQAIESLHSRSTCPADGVPLGSQARILDTRVGTVELRVPKVVPGTYFPSSPRVSPASRAGPGGSDPKRPTSRGSHPQGRRPGPGPGQQRREATRAPGVRNAKQGLPGARNPTYSRPKVSKRVDSGHLPKAPRYSSPAPTPASILGATAQRRNGILGATSPGQTRSRSLIRLVSGRRSRVERTRSHTQDFGPLLPHLRMSSKRRPVASPKMSSKAASWSRSPGKDNPVGASPPFFAPAWCGRCPRADPEAPR
jgi:hypothetical protein